MPTRYLSVLSRTEVALGPEATPTVRPPREPLKRREPLQPRLDIPEIDLGPNEGDLVFDRGIGDIDVSGLRPPVGA